MPRMFSGVPLGNGIQGAVIWGERNRLCLTVSHAGFWDRRASGRAPTIGTFAELRTLLEKGSAVGVREKFGLAKSEPGTPRKIYQLGGGTVTWSIAKGWALESVQVGVGGSMAEITMRDPDGCMAMGSVIQNPHKAELRVCLPATAETVVTPAWDHLCGQLAETGIVAPGWNADGTGFVQHLPDGDSLRFGLQLDAGCWKIVTQVGPTPDNEAPTSRRLEAQVSRNVNETGVGIGDLADVELPHPELQRQWEMCRHLLASSLTAQGPASTLQGPFTEDFRLPAWGNDHHLDLNLQMIYGAALPMGQHASFDPLWKMIKSWLPEMCRSGESFFGTPGAMLLPVSADDKGGTAGTYWAGLLDQAGLAWLASLAWQDYRYTGDRDVLETVAYPLLKGAFEGFWAMLDEVPEGYVEAGCDRLWHMRLSAGVSPEYNGSTLDAWGRNPSFQLAAAHRTVQLLGQAAALLDRPSDSRWDTLQIELPPFAVAQPGNPFRADSAEVGEEVRRGCRISLWERKDLDASHRHHSHLGAIYPFETIDPRDASHREIVEASIKHWIKTGHGNWAGWSYPWAAALALRVGQPDAALSLLEWWARNYTNENGWPLHNARFDGISVLGPLVAPQAGSDYSEIFQLDAAMGFLSVICEFFVRCRGDEVLLLPSLPTCWRHCKFHRIRAESGLEISGEVRGGTAEYLSVRATRETSINLCLPSGSWNLRIDGRSDGKIEQAWSGHLNAGQVVKIEPHR